MISILDNTDMPEMADSRARVGWIGIGIKDWPLRRRSRCNHPFAAGDLSFQESISQDGHYRDRIEDEDQQHHRVREVDVQLVVGNRDHQLEADPVEQRHGQIELSIPGMPEPICSTRRWRLRDCLVHLNRFSNFLHVQSLSGMKNSTDHDAAKPPAAVARSDQGTLVRDCGLPTSLSPLQVGPFRVPILTYFKGRAVTRP